MQINLDTYVFYYQRKSIDTTFILPLRSNINYFMTNMVTSSTCLRHVPTSGVLINIRERVGQLYFGAGCLVYVGFPLAGMPLVYYSTIT